MDPSNLLHPPPVVPESVRRPDNGFLATTDTAPVHSDEDATAAAIQDKLQPIKEQASPPTIQITTQDSDTEIVLHFDKPNDVNTSGTNGDPVDDDDKASPSRHLDRGWAWVVMLAAMLTHIMTFGLIYAMVGIFHVELLGEFGRGDSETAWTGSILLGTMLCSGPITSVLVGKFGAQIITIIGGVLSAAGLCLSALAPSLGYLYFTYGALTGFGFGMSYLPCIVMVGRFFEKRRSVATGFVVAGSGMGTFLFAPVIQLIVEHVGWRHGFYIIGAMELTLCLCGATYCPRLIPERPSPEDYLRHLKELEQEEAWEERTASHMNSFLSLGSSLRPGPTTLAASQAVSVAASQAASTAASRGASTNVSTVSFAPHRCAALSVSPLFFAGMRDQDNCQDMGSMEDTRTLTEIMPYTAAMDIFSNRIPSTSTLAVPESIHADSRWGRCISPFYKISRLLRNRFLVIFALSNFILCIGYQLPYVYFKAFALSLDVGEDEWSFILSVMGITDMLGRIFVGFVFDRVLGKHHRMMGYVFSSILAGVLLFSVSLATSYVGLAALASLFALVAGSTDSLTPALLVAFVGLDTLGYSFGLVIEMQGVGFLVGPPLAGALYGVFSDYAVVFYAGSMAFVVAGLVMLLEPAINGRCSLTNGCSCRRRSS